VYDLTGTATHYTQNRIDKIPFQENSLMMQTNPIFQFPRVPRKSGLAKLSPQGRPEHAGRTGFSPRYSSSGQLLSATREAGAWGYEVSHASAASFLLVDRINPEDQMCWKCIWKKRCR
jgi:hypothetical protein